MQISDWINSIYTFLTFGLLVCAIITIYFQCYKTKISVSILKKDEEEAYIVIKNIGNININNLQFEIKELETGTNKIRFVPYEKEKYTLCCNENIRLLYHYKTKDKINNCSIVIIYENSFKKIIKEKIFLNFTQLELIEKSDTEKRFGI